MPKLSVSKPIRNSSAPTDALMDALILKGKTLSLKKTQVPELKKNEILLKTRLVGICNTDLELMRGYMGFNGVLGHEFVAEVVAVQNVAHANWLGKRVGGSINAACNACHWCEMGLSSHCPSRTVLGILSRDGAMAQYFSLPEQNLVEIPTSVSDQHAVYLEPVAAAMEILEQVSIDAAHEVLVIGDGKLGLLIAAVLPGQVTLLGKHAAKLAIAEQQGIRTLNLSEFQSCQYDVVVEASGSGSGLEAAVQNTKPRGTLVLKSTFAGDVPFNPSLLVVNEITVVGSRCGPFDKGLEQLPRLGEQLDAMTSVSFPYEQGLKAFEAARVKENIKVLLEF